MKYYKYTFLLILLLISSCKKDNPISPIQNPYQNEWTLIDTTNSKIPWGGVTSIDFQGNIAWMIAYPGSQIFNPPREEKLTEFNGQNWTVFDSSNFNLSTNSLHIVKVDANGNVLVGTDKGLIIKSGNGWHTVDFQNYSSNSSWITSIFIDSENNYWVGTPDGLFEYTQSKWNEVQGDSLKLWHANVNLITRKNNILAVWISGDGDWGSLYYEKGNTFKIFNYNNSILPNNIIKSMVVDENDVLWIGSYSGLFSFDGTTWKSYNENNSVLTTNYMNVIKIDQNNNKWIGTEGGGLFRINGTSMEQYKDHFQLTMNNFIEDIAIDIYGNKWLGTLNGLLILNNNN